MLCKSINRNPFKQKFLLIFCAYKTKQKKPFQKEEIFFFVKMTELNFEFEILQKQSQSKIFKSGFYQLSCICRIVFLGIKVSAFWLPIIFYSLLFSYKF